MRADTVVKDKGMRRIWEDRRGQIRGAGVLLWSRDEGGEGGVKAIKGGGRSETYSERGREAMMVVAAG